MAAITAYFDDSGTHKKSPVAVAAAWLSRFESWRDKFCPSWDRVRTEEEFECFHFSEFAASNPKSEFASWDDTKKRRVLSRLRGVIKNSVERGFVIAVKKSDYDETVPPDLRKEVGKFHYTWAVRCVMGFIERWREKEKIAEPTEYVFDRMSQGRAEIESIFKEAEKDSDSFHRYGIYKGCHSFRDKRDVLPLQASDLAAWPMYHRAHLQATGKVAHQYAVTCFDDLVQHDFLWAGILTRAEIADWVRQEVEWRKAGNKEVAPRVLTNLVD